MTNVRSAFYHAALFSVAVLLGVAGCGKPTAPPPGATQDTNAPAVELGPESGPKLPADTTTPEGGAPPAGQGDQK